MWMWVSSLHSRILPAPFVSLSLYYLDSLLKIKINDNNQNCWSTSHLILPPLTTSVGCTSGFQWHLLAKLSCAPAYNPAFVVLVHVTICTLQLKFQRIGPLADSFIESQCPSVCVFVCLSPPHAIFFEASYWPSDHIGAAIQPLNGRPRSCSTIERPSSQRWNLVNNSKRNRRYDISTFKRK